MPFKNIRTMMNIHNSKLEQPLSIDLSVSHQTYNIKRKMESTQTNGSPTETQIHSNHLIK